MPQYILMQCVSQPPLYCTRCISSLKEIDVFCWQGSSYPFVINSTYTLNAESLNETVVVDHVVGVEDTRAHFGL